MTGNGKQVISVAGFTFYPVGLVKNIITFFD